MLVRCKSCGRPVYLVVGRSVSECRYCYTGNAVADAKDRYVAPWQLDWRRPLYDALTVGPPWDSAARWLAPFGDYRDTQQRLDLVRKELALQKESQRDDDAARQPAPSPRQPDSQKGFLAQLMRHPFHVLGATPRSTREELAVRQTELALYGQESESREAFGTLTHVRNRLSAEIRWFPQTASDQVDSLMRYVRQMHASGLAGNQAVLVPHFEMKSILAQFNAVRLVFDAQEVRTARELRAALLSLAVLADGLYPGQVLEEINEDRQRSGFAPITDDAPVEAQIAELMSEAVACLVERGASNLESRELLKLSRHLQSLSASRSAAYHNNYLLDAAAEYLQ